MRQFAAAKFGRLTEEGIDCPLHLDEQFLGVEPIKVFGDEANGRFAHIMGPDDIMIELWQPVSPGA